ncbi:hypothetical protein GOV14_04205 [Candidatus Pacearchaeota archaeon]|nr:hypothetical protein [Candidatus Pacearchaeota archaeon]
MKIKFKKKIAKMGPSRVIIVPPALREMIVPGMFYIVSLDPVPEEK